MERIFQPLLFFIARCSRNELIRHIELLKTENEMLRKRLKVRAIFLKPDERARIIQLGEAIGPAVQHLLTIVRYSTYRYWIRNLHNQKPKNCVGRPRTPEAFRELVLKVARETNWGYTRILGELRKLGYMAVSRQTVVNILKQAGIDNEPKRGPGSWDDLVKRHADTLWQCDFFSKRILSRCGLPQAFAMVFLNVATRRVWISPATKKPTGVWVRKQVDAFIEHANRENLPVTVVSRDRDKLYRNNFDHLLSLQGIDVKTLAYRSPNLNAYVERFIQTIQIECLDHFLVFGERHFDYLVKEYVEHYHNERPHQGLGNRVITGEPPPAPSDSNNTLLCRTRLGGLLKHYRRIAA
jgi:putative transposase